MGPFCDYWYKKYQNAQTQQGKAFETRGRHFVTNDWIGFIYRMALTTRLLLQKSTYSNMPMDEWLLGNFYSSATLSELRLHVQMKIRRHQSRIARMVTVPQKYKAMLLWMSWIIKNSSTRERIFRGKSSIFSCHDKAHSYRRQRNATL